MACPLDSLVKLIDSPILSPDNFTNDTPDKVMTYEWRWSGGVWRHGGPFPGVLAELRDKHRKAKAAFVRNYYEKYMRKTSCPDCNGARLNPQALHVRVGQKNVNEVSALSIQKAAAFFENLQTNGGSRTHPARLSPTERIIAREVLEK